MEAEFLEKTERERQTITTAQISATNELEGRKADLQKRIDSFNTKEARYVARQKQDDQITELKGWLKEWGLTKGTKKEPRGASLHRGNTRATRRRVALGSAVGFDYIISPD